MNNLSVSQETVEKNKEVVRTLLENNDVKNFDPILEMATTDFVGHHHYMPDGVHGNQGLKDFFYLVEGIAFPDGHHEIHHLFGEGDLVTVNFTYEGTFKAALPDGTQPNGKKIKFRYNCICRLVNEKIAEIWWFEFDTFDLMKRLGMI